MFVKHAEEIAKYIESKYPDIPVHVSQDISVFAATRAYVLCANAVNAYIVSERKRYDKYSRRYRPSANRGLNTDDSNNQ